MNATRIITKPCSLSYTRTKMKKTKEENPVKVVGNWKVMDDGTLKGEYTNPAGLTSELTIYPDKLTDEKLMFRLYKYQAVAKDEWYDFLGAFAAACEIIGLNQVTIQISR